MSEHVLFVGDLAPEVDEHYLQSFFAQYYSTVRSVAVMNKGFGYVRFSSEAERDRAIQDMNGVFIGSRAVRVSAAAPKGGPSGALPPGGGGRGGRESAGPDDVTNTTLFVGGLNSMVDENQLRSVFEPFGSVAYARIPPGKGCGFVQFMDRAGAEKALQELNGTYVASCAMRITWGKSTKPIGSMGGGGGGDRPYHPPPSHSSGGGGYHHAASAHHAYPGYPPYSAAQYAGYPGYDAYGAAAYAGYSDPAYAYGAYAAQAAHPYAAATSPTAAATAAASTATDRSDYRPAPSAVSAVGGGNTGSTGGAGAGGAGGTGAAAHEGPYDPLVAVSVERQNAAYLQRLLPVLSGSFLRLKA